MPLTVILPDASATETLGAVLAAPLLEAGLMVYLEGQLGAGKTTLVRGLLRTLGHRGPVRSPTYTLIEPYELGAAGRVLHLDLYRLADPEELDYLGVRELDAPAQLVLVEWPERGAGRLPPADLSLALSVAGSGRRARIMAHTAAGEACLRDSRLDKALKHMQVSPSI